jgi:comEA protein
MPKKVSGELHLSPAWWIVIGILIGLGAAGLIVLLASPQRGQPIVLLPAPTASATELRAAILTSTPVPTAGPLLVNINTATMEELQQLPNIGPVTAQAIVSYRQSHGDFTELRQLMNVSGIGAKTFDGIEAFITLGGQ